MDYDIVAAIVAGLVATGVMLPIMYIMGSMMSRSSGPLYLMGFMMHFGMGVIYAIVHTSLYQAFGLESELLVWGLLFGAVHWVVASMGMMGSMHPRIRDGELAAPGAFLKNYPMMSVVGFLMLHLIFGLVVGSVYEAVI
jgi:hypothetical protein